jgi:hypothetical protein
LSSEVYTLLSDDYISDLLTCLTSIGMFALWSWLTLCERKMTKYLPKKQIKALASQMHLALKDVRLHSECDWLISLCKNHGLMYLLCYLFCHAVE